MKRSAAIFALLAVSAVALRAADTTTSCVTCHAALQGALARPARLYPNDVHFRAGLTCADCHGGDPHDTSLNAMSPAKGFRGAPKRPQIPEFCARCHSNPAFMRRYNPSLRTDQFSQYVTSIHGKRLKQGDANVAVCVDCHSVHDILKVSDPQAPVYPTNVPQTCGRCHANPAYMKSYRIPTNQFALYEKSVHAKALAGGDVSAPTCATCHGNHGATPPGASSVADVCGTCHAMNQQLFAQSPHGPAFAAMGLAGCVECHSNHEILPPSDAWVGSGPSALCTKCHTAGDSGSKSAQAMAGDLARLKSIDRRARETLGVAERSGMEVSSALMALTQAHSQLVKARVNIHAFSEPDIRKDTDEGAKIAQQAYEAGVAALRERDIRRKGLGVSLIFVTLTMIALYLKIRQIESQPSATMETRPPNSSDERGER